MERACDEENESLSLLGSTIGPCRVVLSQLREQATLVMKLLRRTVRTRDYYARAVIGCTGLWMGN